jgi:hypothetical protein
MRDLATLLKWSFIVVSLALSMRIGAGLVSPRWAPLPDGLINDQPATPSHETSRVPESPWVLLVGGSTINEAVELSRLDFRSRKQSIPLGRASDIAFALNWDLQRSPKENWPELIVWGVHPVNFVQRSPHPALTKVSRDRYDRNVARAIRLEGSSVPLSRRDKNAIAWNHLDPWFSRRAVVQEAGVVGVRMLVDRDSGLSQHSEEIMWHFKSGRRHLRRQGIDRYKSFKTFIQDPMVPLQSRSLDYILERCREAGVPLLIVGMPEHGELRNLYQRGSRETFRRHFVGEGVDFVDWHDLIPDHHFSDHGHVSQDGRATFTDMLNKTLEARLNSLGR